MFHHDLKHTGLSIYNGPDTARVKWIFQTGDRIYGSASIGEDGTVYIGTNDRYHPSTDSKLYAIYPNGTEKWHWTPPSHSTINFIDSTPAVAADGTVYVGCRDGHLYALYSNGTEKWDFDARPWWCCKDFDLTSPAIGSDGTIYIGNNNHRLYAINSDGTLKWSYKTRGAIRSSPAIGPDGTIYVGSHDRKLHAINPDGTRKWRYSTGCRIVSSPAIGPDGTIYVGSHDRKLHAINPDGTRKWRYSTGCYVLSSPAIDSDGTIYVGSYDKNIYAISPDGSLLWKYYTGDRIHYSSPAIAADGTVYIGNRGGKLYAFGPGLQSNAPPELEPIGDRMVNETETLTIDLEATDPDGDLLTYSCNRTDLFTDFDPATGTGNWTTDYNDSGVYRVDFGVSDTAGGIANETIRIEVLNVNRPPVLDPVGDKVVNENSLLEFTITASDPDGDSLAYAASNLPDGATFDPGTREFAWTPDFDQAGTYPDVHFEVTDGELTDWENITIVVTNTDRAPVLDHIDDRSVDENDLLEFTVNASDPDGDILTYSASNLPDGATFDPGTREFSWTPDFDQEGTYPDVHFEVTDGELTDWENITIVVNTTNRAPVLDPIGDRSIDENSLLEFVITASDPDGDSLAYSASNLPAGAAFNLHTQVFSWTPGFDQEGTYPDIHFEVNDSELTDYEDITIVVTNTDRAPILDPIGDRSIDENSLLEFVITASDPDGDSLAYSASNLPDGAVFNLHTQVFSWTPGFDQEGTYPDIHFEVNDSELTDYEDITIVVTNTDRAPILNPIRDKTVDENSLLEFVITASDPDGDSLAYAASNLPDGAAFDPVTREFAWTPDFDQEGTYPDIHFEVTDGELTDYEDITITVENINRPPVLDPIGDKTVDENSLLEFTITASDPDGDILTYAASNLPDGATFDSSTREFSWTPDFDQAGTYPDVHFEVTDGELTDYEDITIVVADVAAPMISVVAPYSEIMFQQQFIVNITVDPMMNEIYGVQYLLTFNNSVLHCEWQNEGTFLSSDGADTNVYINTIDNGAGTISFAATRVGAPDGVTDPGTLATIKFTAILKGECSDLTLTYIVAADENAEAIDPVDITGSSICVDENQPPVAIGRSMHRYNNDGQKHLCKVYFNGTESYDPDGNIVYWRWSFGDGNYGTGELKDHVYQSWRWNGTGYDPFTAVLTVTDDGDLHELDDSASFDVIVYTAGDANGDGRVNILDATIVGLEWGKTTDCSGAYCWEGNDRGSQADLNNDCKVNILDAVIVGTCWGHTAW
ncbi:MAG: putative Ig domain-containing protein [Methanosarcinales archaeon]